MKIKSMGIMFFLFGLTVVSGNLGAESITPETNQIQVPVGSAPASQQSIIESGILGSSGGTSGVLGYSKFRDVFWGLYGQLNGDRQSIQNQSSLRRVIAKESLEQLKSLKKRERNDKILSIVRGNNEGGGGLLLVGSYKKGFRCGLFGDTGRRFFKIPAGNAKLMGRLQILKAFYGDLNLSRKEKSRVIDVTKKLKVADNQVKIEGADQFMNRIFTDPAPGIVKGLLVFYRVGENVYARIFNEYQAVAISTQDHGDAYQLPLSTASVVPAPEQAPQPQETPVVVPVVVEPTPNEQSSRISSEEPKPSEQPEGILNKYFSESDSTIIAIGSTGKGPMGRGYLKNDGKMFTFVKEFEDKPEFKYTIVRLPGEGYFGIKSMVSGKILRSSVAEGYRLIFDADGLTSPESQFVIWAPDPAQLALEPIWLYNRATKGYISVRSRPNEIVTKDHTNTGAKNNIWEELFIEVKMSAVAAPEQAPQPQEAPASTGLPVVAEATVVAAPVSVNEIAIPVNPELAVSIQQVKNKLAEQAVVRDQLTSEIQNNQEALTTLKSQPETLAANQAVVTALESSNTDLTTKLDVVNDDSARLENQLMEASKQQALLQGQVQQGQSLSVSEIVEKAPLATVPVAELFAPAAQARVAQTTNAQQKQTAKKKEAKKAQKHKEKGRKGKKRQVKKNAKKAKKAQESKSKKASKKNKQKVQKRAIKGKKEKASKKNRASKKRQNKKNKKKQAAQQ